MIQLNVPESYDLARTLWLAGMGTRDPSLRYSRDESWLAFHTPDGTVTVHGQLHGTSLQVECEGQGSRWIESRLSGLFGLGDDPQSFQPDGKLGELVRQHPGMHLPQLPVVFHRLVQIVLQQLVSWPDALRGWLLLTKRYGTDAPGTAGLRVGPSPERLAELGYYDIVSCGIMPKQARLILQLARERNRIERLAEQGHEALGQYLQTIRGIGAWTIGHLAGTSLGHADAVLPGDFGLPHSIAWLLVGQERSDDEQMLGLLEPYAGHRFRIVNLVWQNSIEAPRRGPKMRTNRWRFTEK